MKRLIFSVSILLLVISCAPSTPKPEKIMVQCWDGSIAENATQCPPRVLIQCWDGTIAESREACPPQQIIEQELEKQEPEVLSKAVVPEKTRIQELLEKVPRKYWFADELGWGGGSIVIGNKRSLGKYDPQRFNMFWNTDTKDVYVFAGEISKKWWNQRNNISTSSAITYAYLPAFYKYNFITNPDIRSKYYADPAGIYNKKSPVDWMEEYQYEKPIKIEQVGRTINLLNRDMYSNLTLHFKKIGNPERTISMYFDTLYHVPLVVEEYQDFRFVNRRKYIFEKFWEDDLKRRYPIGEEIVNLPKDSIIITPEIWEQYRREFRD